MTLTSAGCPLASVIDRMVRESVGKIPGVKDVALELVWDPPWTPQLMSESARAELNIE
jgi:metal-sulfur cluster biosynthetic enzyme